MAMVNKSGMSEQSLIIITRDDKKNSKRWLAMTDRCAIIWDLN